jgi:hypothetical protein
MNGGSRRELVVGGRMSVVGNHPTSPLLKISGKGPERGHGHAPKGRPPDGSNAPKPAFPPQHRGISKARALTTSMIS